MGTAKKVRSLFFYKPQHSLKISTLWNGEIREKSIWKRPERGGKLFDPRSRFASLSATETFFENFSRVFTENNMFSWADCGKPSTLRPCACFRRTSINKPSKKSNYVIARNGNRKNKNNSNENACGNFEGNAIKKKMWVNHRRKNEPTMTERTVWRKMINYKTIISQ